MNAVQRTRGVRKIFRKIIFGETAPKYATAGEKNCGKMMREARTRRQKSGPSDRDIQIWAEFELMQEILDGYWNVLTA